MKKLFFTWLVCLAVFGRILLPAFAESGTELETGVQGGGGLEFNLPYGYTDFLPGVRVKVALPLELYPWQPPAGRDVGAALRLNWGGRLALYGGNLSFGGPTSLFTTAAPVMTLNPLSALAFPAAVVSVGMPSSGGSAAPYGAAVTATLGNIFSRTRVSLWAAGSEKKRFFAGAALPLKFGRAELHLSSAAGIWFLDGNLPDLDDGWFSASPVFDAIWLKGAVLEARLKWSGIKVYGGGALVEQPQGGFGYWGRLRSSVDFALGTVPLRILAGLYGGRPGSITADGSTVKESFQVYVNPQATVKLDGLAPWLKGGRFRVGLAFGAGFKNTNELHPELFADGKLRGAVALTFPGTSVQLIGEWLGIRLNKPHVKASFRAEERLGGSMNLSLGRLLPRFSLKLSAAAHYEKRGGRDRDRIAVSGRVNLNPAGGGKFFSGGETDVFSGRKSNWFSLIPDIGAATELVFKRAGGFHSASTEAKVSWNIPFPYVKLGIWVAVQLKHTAI